ncbi:ABC transporter ATP-binding protein [Thermosediminibacter litoriperuensis]|uniref:NitT/TauT family transport system ATP-binding protein n=1 Tax=Thermosediminibacter litoriperuensis TaxID=291989 RepID=A0A5S5AI49_9FIRM|nr:ABC transporter ATP-binding protein [Thermosediminibacter litoriperuensis]TYP50355.1 NitT/TauT family transport system ATP-binding protein [Thermosediminibacter litoriperuensis]
MITVRNLEVFYKSSRGKFMALAGVNLDVEKGGIVAVIGPSGCGKSTLLYTLAGIIKEFKGEVLIDKTPIDPRKHRIGLVLQDYGLLPWKNVIENSLLGLRVKKKITKTDREYAEYLLSRMGLSGLFTRYPGELSGGQRQRVAIARAFILKPDILLMDEPLSALDAITREEMQDLFLDVWKGDSISTVFVTHSTEEAMYLGKKIAVMTGPPGRIVKTMDNPFFGAREIKDPGLYFSIKSKLKDLIKGRQK